jgi:MYND finger
MEKVCTVCNATSKLRCGKCKDTYYCGREHQAEDWPEHKSRCKNVSTRGTKSAAPPINILIPPSPTRSAEETAALADVSAQNQKLLQLCWPYVRKLEAQVLQFENLQRRCFIVIEVSYCTGATAVAPFKVCSHVVLSSERAAEYAELAGSVKLKEFCAAYKLSKQLPCLFWCRKPSASYTILVVPPWSVQEYVQTWNDIDNMRYD